MTDSFGASVRIDKPIEEVFNFLANGQNAPPVGSS
jgi:hypothetical protein